MAFESYLTDIIFRVLSTFSQVYVLVLGIVTFLALYRLTELERCERSLKEGLVEEFGDSEESAGIGILDGTRLKHGIDSSADRHLPGRLKGKRDLARLRETGEKQEILMTKLRFFLVWHLPAIFLPLIALFFAQILISVFFLFYLLVVVFCCISAWIIYDLMRTVFTDRVSLRRQVKAPALGGTLGVRPASAAEDGSDVKKKMADLWKQMVE